MLSDDGYVYWIRGPLWFSLAQCCDNVLPASTMAPDTHTTRSARNLRPDV